MILAEVEVEAIFALYCSMVFRGIVMWQSLSFTVDDGMGLRC